MSNRVENETGIDTDNCSPQFISEVKRCKARIKDHIENNFLRKTFQSLSTNIEPDPLLSEYFITIIRKMEEKEKAILIKEVITLCHEDTANNQHFSTIYESTVDNLIRTCLEQNCILPLHCIESLIMTTDFTMKNRIDQQKWSYITKALPQIDYKGIRNIFRCIQSQLQRMPSVLTPEQVAEFKIVEDIILKIVDRDSNLLPPIITLSELMRQSVRHVQMLPRISAKFSEIAVHFRPIADLTHNCGRSFMHPIVQHPAYPSNGLSWDELGGTSAGNPTHMLPYRPEHSPDTNYTHTLFMLLKQPKGKDSFNLQLQKGKKSVWDVIISVIIMQAMAEAETLGETEVMSRYLWDNISNILIYGLQHSLVSPKGFAIALRKMMARFKFTRGRDELMWLLLQMIGSIHNNSQMVEETIPMVFEIYKILFDGDVSWMGASDHPALLARFLAAASISLILNMKENLPATSKTLQSHIDHITSEAAKFDPSDTNNMAIVAVLANSFRRDSDISKKIVALYLKLLDSNAEDGPLFQLPYSRHAANRINALSFEYLDALTLRAKKGLMDSCMGMLRGLTVEKLPSPAVLETIARIVESEDFENAGKDLVIVAQRNLTLLTQKIDTLMQLIQQCAFLFDLFCYRIHYIPLINRTQMIFAIMSLFTKELFFKPFPTHMQLYTLLEQSLIRLWCMSNFHDSSSIFYNLFSKPFGRYFATPDNFINIADSYRFPCSPQVFRMAFSHTMRCLKITGQELQGDPANYMIPIKSLAWPDKAKKAFPRWMQEKLKDVTPAQHETNFDDIKAKVMSTIQIQPTLTALQFTATFAQNREEGHLLYAVIFQYLRDNKVRQTALPQPFFGLIENKTSREVIVGVNLLVDYVIGEAKQDTDPENMKQQIAAIAKLLTKMVYKHDIIRVDRLLLSLLMHPTTDENMSISMQIIYDFVQIHRFTSRIEWFHQHVPRKESSFTEFLRKNVEFHDLYPEREVYELNNERHAPEVVTNHRLPTYYGSQIERLIPIVDNIIHVAVEQIQTAIPTEVLQTLSLFYKYHPEPIRFMYTVLFTNYGVMKKPDAKNFVLALQQHVEDAHLTVSFEKFNHQNISEEALVMELLDRMEASLDFVLTPPPFVSKDWKTAEFSPAAQTLYLACIELMASPHSHERLVEAMIGVFQMKPHIKPYNVINLMSLLLTALPSEFAESLHNTFNEMLNGEEIEQLSFEDLVFDNFETKQLQHICSKTQVVNVLEQSYWSHSPAMCIQSFCKNHMSRVMEHVKTENGLWYAIRLAVPFIRRYTECLELSKLLRSDPNSYGPLVILRQIFMKVGELADNNVELKYEQYLCDVMYNCKYVFAGDFLRETALENFPKLPPKMRERLKFYVSAEPPVQEYERRHVTATSSNANEQVQQQPQQQQQQQGNEVEMRDVSGQQQQPQQEAHQQQQQPQMAEQQPMHPMQPHQQQPQQPHQMDHPMQQQHMQMTPQQQQYMAQQQMLQQQQQQQQQQHAMHPMHAYGMQPQMMGGMPHQMHPMAGHNPMMNMTPQQYSYMMQQQHQQQQHQMQFLQQQQQQHQQQHPM